MSKVIWIVLLLSSSFAQAQTISTGVDTGPAAPGNSSKTSVVEILGNKKFRDDHEITDAKLRADSGSLSRYSLKASLGYQGAAVGEMNSPNLPNVDNMAGTYKTSLRGNMAGRFRLDMHSALNFGTGINMLTPVQGTKRTDVSNPFISYDKTMRLGEFQTRNSLGYSLITNPDFTKLGETNAVGYDSSVVYNLGTTPFALGLDAGVNYFIFDRRYLPSDHPRTERYTVGLFPQLKYNFSDRLDVSTSVAIMLWNPRVRDDQGVLWNKSVGERIGFGYAFTRDIYFAPYLSLFPQELSSDTTTLNFMTIFSIL